MTFGYESFAKNINYVMVQIKFKITVTIVSVILLWYHVNYCKPLSHTHTHEVLNEHVKFWLLAKQYFILCSILWFSQLFAWSQTVYLFVCAPNRYLFTLMKRCKNYIWEKLNRGLPAITRFSDGNRLENKLFVETEVAKICNALHKRL